MFIWDKKKEVCLFSMFGGVLRGAPPCPSLFHVELGLRAQREPIKHVFVLGGRLGGGKQ